MNKTILLSVFLAIGCTGGGAAGCSGDSSSSAARLDSQLGAIYEIGLYQESPVDAETGLPVPNACDLVADSTPSGPYLVLWGVQMPSDPDELLLGGVFCRDVDACREQAREPTPLAVNYSFSQGSDEAGWVGFGRLRQGRENDQCLVEILTHRLEATGDSIRIDSESNDIIFPPDEVMGQDVTCSVATAVQTLASSTDLPCVRKFVLEATRVSNL